MVIPVPYDSGSSWMTGSRGAPRAIIEASLEIDPFDAELGLNPSEAGIHTLPEVDLVRDSSEASFSAIEESVSRVVTDGKIPVILGGDHSVTQAAFSAVASRGEVAYVVLDAHLDMYDSYQGSRHSHACTSMRCAERAVGAVIIGARTASPEELEAARRLGVSVVWAADLEASGVDAIRDALDSLPSRRAYLSIDADFLDPSIVPCVGNPEPGGLGWRMALKVISAVAESLEVCAVDLVEFIPCWRWDVPLTLAKLVYKTIGFLELFKPPG